MRSECPFPDGLCICVGGVESHRHPEDRERIAAELGRERLRIADLEAELAEAREAEKAMRERMEWTVTDNAKQRMAVDDLRAKSVRLRGVASYLYDWALRQSHPNGLDPNIADAGRTLAALDKEASSDE